MQRPHSSLVSEPSTTATLRLLVALAHYSILGRRDGGDVRSDWRWAVRFALDLLELASDEFPAIAVRHRSFCLSLVMVFLAFQRSGVGVGD